MAHILSGYPDRAKEPIQVIRGRKIINFLVIPDLTFLDCTVEGVLAEPMV